MSRYLTHLASYRLTIVSLLFVAVSVIWFYNEMPAGTYVLVASFTLALSNLACMIALRPAFQRQPALTLFHLALAAIIVLAALGRLVYFHGHVEVAQGQQFDPRQVEYEAGLLHRLGLQQVMFFNEGHSIEYHPGVRRGATRNTVLWRPLNGDMQRKIIGDNHPLVIAGYSFYTSSNKGYAPTFSWRRTGSATTETGAVHLPSYPLREFEQAREWQVPQGELKLWTQMVLEEELLDPQHNFKLGAIPAHHIVVRDSNRRFEMRPGDQLMLSEGVLTYQGLRTWMGYTIYYDWTRSWIVAAGVLAVISMGWYYFARFSARSWEHFSEEMK